MALKALVGGLVIIGTLALGVTEAHAQGAYYERGHHADPGLGPQIVAALNLTPAQQYRIRALQAAMTRELADEQAHLRALRTQMYRARAVSNPNELLIASLNRQINAVRQVIHQRHLRFRADVMRTLTPGQRQQLRRIRQSTLRRAARGQGDASSGASTAHLGQPGPATFSGRRVPGQLQLGPQLMRIEPPQWNISPYMPTSSPINAQ